MDIHSHGNPNATCVTHLTLDLSLDFEKQQAAGTATLALERKDPAAPLVLDAQGLAVERVTGGDGRDRKYALGPEDPNIGQALTIELAPEDTKITVHYHTTDKSGAMQWLAPEQTAGGKRPFLFTQGQSIFTRTWIPIQDSPAVRVTYDATIRAPKGMTAVMSADRLDRGKDGAFRFEMKLPIPTYLIALACGDLEFRPISGRSGIWAEPSVVDGARREFEDTETMIAAVERIFGPYRWGRYDLLVLPPSFPFGGMENPTLTFATPTVLAGDKSLVSIVAHELSHSWSGNLVTNATWSDFWLNEGFTMYLEGRTMEAVYGKDRALMEQQLGRAELEREMKDLDPKDQVLHVDLRGRHPDDGFTTVPYEKAAMFLRRIEELVGREAFDRFLKGYFDAHAFQSITTEDFVGYLKANLLDARPDAAAKLDIDLWLSQPGLPADAPAARSKALADVDRALEAYARGVEPAKLETAGWVTQQWQHFLTNLPASVDAERMAQLDAAFAFTKSHNSEILGEWLRLSIERHYSGADARLEEFLMEVGRRKFLKPLYTELAKTDAGKVRAKEIYAKARPRYHAICQAAIDKIVS